jgi:hypothetical protein
MDDVWKGLTALIAFSAFLVALAQWRMAREKLRLDLFERRYRVFDATKVFLTSIFRTGRIDPQNQHDFRAATRDCVFLFRSGVGSYLEVLNEKAARLQYLRERTDTGPGFVNIALDEDGPAHGPPDAAERAQFEAEIHGVHLWAGSQLTEGKLQRAFLPYLRFQDQWSWFAATLLVLGFVVGVSVLYLWFRGPPTSQAASACVPVCQLPTTPLPAVVSPSATPKTGEDDKK